MQLNEIPLSRIQMADEIYLLGERRRQREHYPPSSYRDPLTPPEICPKCGTPTHQEFDMIYCKDRHHSWAVPVPDPPSRFKMKYYEKPIIKLPIRVQRTITCKHCGETVSGTFTRNQKYCTENCYVVARRISNREAYRHRNNLSRDLGA